VVPVQAVEEAGDGLDWDSGCAGRASNSSRAAVTCAVVCSSECVRSAKTPVVGSWKDRRLSTHAARSSAPAGRVPSM
jgi:hypothetical protein